MSLQTEAAEIISDHLFSKNWVGTKDKTGRMWQDNLLVQRSFGI